MASNPSSQKHEGQLPLSGSGSPQKQEGHLPLSGSGSPQKQEGHLPLLGSGSPQKLEGNLPLSDHLIAGGCIKTDSNLSVKGSQDESYTGRDDDLPDTGGLSNTTIWARHFPGIKAYAACDALTTALDGSSASDRKKKFQQLTQEIFVTTSGSRPVNMACVARLRSICRHHQTTSPRKPLTLEQLVTTFRSNSDMAILWFKVTQGRTLSSLLLVTTEWEGTRSMVCKLEARRGKLNTIPTFVSSFSNEDGAGSGYSTALPIFSTIPNNATQDEVKTVVRKAFQAAARRDGRTGGHVLLFEAIYGSPWEFVDFEKLIGNPKQNKN